ncbi:MAG: DUF1559 domain-containing protein [Planctomycetia bacterium]|nr:DUF1559 domain-containing protein [Planctomycetia bacterium]
MDVPRRMRSSGDERRTAGFNLVELLVVCAIVAVLIGFLLPAVQGAREAARMTACRNHIRQLSTALLHHEASLQHYPSGGWGPTWLPVADRASDAAQPGGWTFGVLPYLEANSTRGLIGTVDATTAAAAYQQFAKAGADVFACPSRRASRAVQMAAATSYKTMFTAAQSLPMATLTDYAANGGSTATCPPIELLELAIRFVDSSTKVTFCHVPPGNSGNYQTQTLSLSATEQGHADHTGDHIGPCFSCDDDMATIAQEPASLTQGDAWSRITPLGRLMLPDGGIPDLQNGILHRMSRITAPAVKDGLSNTYLMGEKNVAADQYESGADAGDNRALHAGYSSSNVRWAYETPMQDERGTSHPNVFGSPHRAGWNAALADGSVRTIVFDIDLQVHRGLAARADGRGTVPD